MAAVPVLLFFRVLVLKLVNFGSVPIPTSNLVLIIFQSSKNCGLSDVQSDIIDNTTKTLKMEMASKNRTMLSMEPTNKQLMEDIQSAASKMIASLESCVNEILEKLDEIKW